MCAAAGQLSEAAWCLIRLRKTCEEAKEQEQQCRWREEERLAAASSHTRQELADAATGAAAVAALLEQRCMQLDEELRWVGLHAGEFFACLDVSMGAD
jgi:hypothetical protein